jgi:hypothetical protein
MPVTVASSVSRVTHASHVPGWPPPGAYEYIAGLLASVLCIYTTCPPSRRLSSPLLSLVSSEYSSLRRLHCAFSYMPSQIYYYKYIKEFTLSNIL